MARRIPKELDKRRKLTDEQKKEIYDRYTDPNNKLSMEKLGQEYGVTRYTVYYIVNPDKRIENSKSSFSKEKHNEYMRNYSRRRRELEKKGMLIDIPEEQPELLEKDVNNMNRIIYHGNYMEIKYPDIRKQRFTKDFSWGFYCTEIKDQAEKWASKFNTPIVSVYELTKIEELNIKSFDDYTDEWLNFVVDCRNGGTHNYDIVIGPMADDTIYDYIDAYTQGQMNKQKFFDLMKSKYPTHQISFHTIKSLDHIRFIKSYNI